MMYSDPQQQQQQMYQQHPPPPPPHQQMMKQHHQMGEFGGPPQQKQPPPPQMLRQPSVSSTTFGSGGGQDYHQQLSHPPFEDNFAAKRMRKIGQRRAVDYSSTVVRYMQTRLWQRDSRDMTVLQPTPAAAIDIIHPPVLLQSLFIRR